VFNRVVTATAALSSALAVAVVIVWCIHSNAPATNVQDPSMDNDPEWQNVTRKVGMRYGDSVYDLSLTQAGFKLSAFEAVNPNKPLFAVAYLEHFYSLVILFLVLPAVWLIRTLRMRGRFAHTAEEEPVVIPPDQRRWAIKSLLVGILGLPIYVATVAFSSSLAGPIGTAPGLAGAIQIGFFLGFPPCCVAFAYKEQSHWRGNAVGEAGAFLTMLWFAFWVVFFFFSLVAA
jgi:hypothetical protein